MNSSTGYRTDNSPQRNKEMKKYTFKDGRSEKLWTVEAEDYNIARVMIRMKRSFVRPLLVRVESGVAKMLCRDKAVTA